MSPERASQGSTVCAPSTSGASRARTPASPISGINATSRAANASMQICAGSSVRYSPRKSGQTRWPLHSRAGRARASVQLTNVQTIPAENTAGAFRPEAPPACASVSTAAAASALQAYEAYDAHEPGVHIGRREVRRRSSRSGQSITRKAGMGPHRATATTITESTSPNSATRLKITSPAIAQMASSSSPTNRTGWRQSDAYPASHNVAGSPPTNPSSTSMNHVRRRMPRSLARKASCQLPNVCNDGRASMPLAPSYPDRSGAGKRSDSPPDHAERSYTQYWGTEPIQLSSNLHRVVTYLGLYSSRSEQRTEVTFGLTGRLYEVGRAIAIRRDALPRECRPGGFRDRLDRPSYGCARIGGLKHGRIACLFEHLAHEPVDPRQRKLDDHRAVGQLRQHRALLARPPRPFGRDQHTCATGSGHLAGAWPAGDVGGRIDVVSRLEALVGHLGGLEAVEPKMPDRAARAVEARQVPAIAPVDQRVRLNCPRRELVLVLLVVLESEQPPLRDRARDDGRDLGILPARGGELQPLAGGVLAERGDDLVAHRRERAIRDVLADQVDRSDQRLRLDR